MQRSSRKATLATLATLVHIAALAGCGDDGSTSTTTATTSADTTGGPQTSDPTTTQTTQTTQTTTPTTTEGPDTDTPPDPTTTGPTTEGPGTEGPTTTPETDGTMGSETGHMTDVVMTTGSPASCDDAELNQDETDIDCGGPNCGPCPDGSTCSADEDCQVASCVLNVCAAPSCADGVQNAAESAVDCGGGECPACGDGLGCGGDSDCESQICTEGVCAAPTCADGVINGEETDLDCGGSICDGCLGDAECIDDSDCLSGSCTGGICEPVDCFLDNDCNALDTECTAGACQQFKCVATPKNEGMACEGVDLCVNDTVCGNGVCGGGTPVDCSAMSDACHMGSCDPGTGQCTSTELADGVKCEDGNACTKLETCLAGTCGGSLAALFTEDFSDNMAGWTLGPDWAIGATKASVGCSNGQDPALDHSPGDDNGVAGVVLGGCIPSKTVHDNYCLTSPVIDLTAAPADVHLSFWRWLVSDYTPYMKNQIQVFNGTTWVTLLETGGLPAVADKAWGFFSYDVSAYKNPAFQARWCFSIGSTGVFLVPSWNVDDVTVGPAACMQ